MPKKPTAAELLVDTFAKDDRSVRPSVDTLATFGFFRCDSDSQFAKLASVYRSLIRRGGINAHTLDKWMSKGSVYFGEKIREVFMFHPTTINADCIAWITANQHIWNPEIGILAYEVEQGHIRWVRRRFPDKSVWEDFLKGIITESFKAECFERHVRLDLVNKTLIDEVYDTEAPVTAMTSTDHLFNALNEHQAPAEPQTMRDYGFDCCHFAEDTFHLVAVYNSLIKICRIKPKTLHEWMGKGKGNLGKRMGHIFKYHTDIPSGVVAWFFINKRRIWGVTPDVQEIQFSNGTFIIEAIEKSGYSKEEREREMDAKWGKLMQMHDKWNKQGYNFFAEINRPTGPLTYSEWKAAGKPPILAKQD